MSQYTFVAYMEYQKAVLTVKVYIGWDRPMQGFFMVIEPQSRCEKAYIYSNLFDDSPNKDIDYYFW